MRMILLTAAACAAMAMTAQADQTRVVVRHGGEHANMDGDHDGWLSRAEASAGFERMFARLDRNNDGRLNSDDHGDDDNDLADLPDMPGGPGDENCTRTESGDGAERHVTVICTDERQAGAGAESGERSERHTERHVRVVRGGHGGHPPMGAMPMMMMMHSGEGDANNDGATSREEFRAQHLRFFDAADVNGDGRLRMPEHHAGAAPTPPTPPTPPPPPPRRR